MSFKEYIKKEEEIINSSIKSNESISFFPEIDRIIDTKTIGFRANITIPIKILVLLFDTIIFPVYNVKDKKEFRTLHGIDFDTFISLVDRNIVIPLVNITSKTKFPDFFSQLFQYYENIISAERYHEYISYLSGKRYEIYLQQAKNLFKDKFMEIGRKKPKWSLIIPEKFLLSPELLRFESAQNLAILKSMGVDTVINTLVRSQELIRDPIEVYTKLEIYAHYLLYPLLHGVIENLIDSETIISNQLEQRQLDRYLFPQEIGYYLIKGLKILYPDTLDIQELMMLRESEASKNIRKICLDLMKRFRKNNYTGIRKFISDYMENFTEISTSLKNIENIKSFVHCFDINIGVSGLKSDFSILGLEGVLESQSYVLSVDKQKPDFSSLIYRFNSILFFEWINMGIKII